jgi:ABC-type multidrug transport system fused ATPase/permease subunit
MESGSHWACEPYPAHRTGAYPGGILMLLADYTFGQGLLTVLAVFLFAAWLMVLFTIFADLFRDHELSGWWKALWVVFLIFLPFLGLLVYLIARGPGMRDRATAERRQAREQLDAYVRQTVGSGSAADELAKLAKLHDEKQISDDEYERAKARIVG